MKIISRNIVGAVLAMGICFSMLLSTSVVFVGAADSDRDYVFVQFTESPTQWMKDEIQDMGGIFHQYYHPNTYLVEVETAKLGAIEALYFVLNIRVYEPHEKIDPGLKGATGDIDLRIVLHNGVDTRTVVEALELRGVDITRVNTVSVNYVICSVDSTLLSDIASIKEVRWMQQVYEPQTLMDNIQSNTFMGADTPQANAFTGSGILAEVIDNGCDFSHTDLGQIQYTDFSPIADSHGTCTSGIMFGDGTGNMAAQGIMYEGIGVFGDWGNGNALGISNLWLGTFTSGNAGQNGVVQTNSWWNGATMDGEYDAMSNELDQAIVDNPKVLTHWAIGNSNSGEAEGLMSAESISKNNMGVGAIFHMDTASTADDDWHSNGAGATPSRGPAADGRAKPDMLACFDWILCTDQMGAPGYTGTDYYDNFGGTSGATPTVAGCSGLTYEMYQENFFDNNPTNELPYSCTIKALMIADAYQYPMTVPNQITRNVQGWGSPDMENMYNLGDQYHVIEEYPQALDSGDSWNRGVFSDGVNPLKITLAWVDPAAPETTIAGRALINNLDLHVTSPSGTQYWGNNGLGTALYSSSGTGAQRWSSTASYRDDLNNVENVFILAPEVGVWNVEVVGRTGDIGQGPQDFSVVASGAAGISSMGTIDLDKAVYMLEDTATITVTDLDLDTDSGTIQTVNVNVDSTTEPTGETILLTETAVDSATFEGPLTLSATNGAGILQVSHADLVTATYNDADDGTGSPAVVTDTATVDGDPPLPPSALTVEWWGMSLQTVYSEDFEGGSLAGWTLGGGSNDWEIGNAGGLGGDPAAAAGGSWWIGNDLTGLGATSGQYENGVLADGNYIYSPAIDCSLCTGTTLEFYRWLGVESATFDHASIEVSNDEAAWTTVWDHTGGSFTDSAWTLLNYDISTVADNEATVYVRFEMGPTDGSVTYCGWNVDDLHVEGLVVGGTDDNCLNWTLSLDDGFGDNDVVVYNIYRANNEFGPWDAGAYIDSVPAGTDQYVDLGRGEFDGINWWYVVRAEDATGNEEQNTVAVPEIPVGNVPPSSPTNPVPAHMAVGVGLNPALSVDVSDPNGDVMDVSFYDASGPTLLGTDFGVPSPGTASVNWLGLSADTTYNWYTVADDGALTTTSPTWQFTTMDTTPPAPPTGLTVEWWGVTSMTWIDEDFSTAVPPAGWNIYVSGTTGTWSQQATANAGGTSPEARFIYGASGIGTSIMYAGPFDTVGLTTMDLQWQNMIDDYTVGTGVTCKIQTSSDAASWTDTGWEWDDTVTPGDMPAALESIVLNTVDVGSSTFYLGWTVDGNSYQLNYWYIDDVLLTSTGGGTTDDNWLNWTLSADDGGGANDVDHYNIYRANNAGGPWDAGALIDTVPAGIDTYMDFGRGQPDGINWWYVVRAEDIWGNEELNTNAVPEIPVGDMPPTVTVGTPNGGESYPVDSLITINWAAGDDNPWPATSCWIYYDTDTNPGNGETFITSAVSAGAGTYDWDSTGVPPGDYYIHIVVEDSIGQQAEDWSDGFFTITPPTYDIDLTGVVPGEWVLVSFPIDATGTVDVVFDDTTWGSDAPGDDITWDYIQWYDNFNKEWRSYSIYKPAPINDMDVIDNTYGFWIHITANPGAGDQQLTVGSGVMPAGAVFIDLYTGWNLVGYPSATPSLASDTLPPEADMVSVCDMGQPYYIRDELPAAVTMSEGNAYWVRVTADCTWQVNP